MLTSNCCVQSSIQDHETAADADCPTRPRANFRFNQDWQPVGFGAYGELRAEELFQSGSEAEREAREVRVKLVQRDVSERRPQILERRAEPQRRRRARPAELDEREIVEATPAEKPKLEASFKVA
jgi:hypothetical protein